MDHHVHPPPRTPTHSPAHIRVPPSPHTLALLPPPPLPTTPRTPKKAAAAHPSPGTPYNRHNPPPPPPKRGVSLGSSNDATLSIEASSSYPPNRARRDQAAHAHALASSIREPPFSTDDNDANDGQAIENAPPPRPRRRSSTNDEAATAVRENSHKHRNKKHRSRGSNHSSSSTNRMGNSHPDLFDGRSSQRKFPERIHHSFHENRDDSFLNENEMESRSFHGEESGSVRRELQKHPRGTRRASSNEIYGITSGTHLHPVQDSNSRMHHREGYDSRQVLVSSSVNSNKSNTNYNVHGGHRQTMRYNRANSVPEEGTKPNNDNYRSRTLSNSLGSDFREFNKISSSVDSFSRFAPSERDRGVFLHEAHRDAGDLFYDNSTPFQPDPLEEDDTSMDNNSIILYEDDDSAESTEMQGQNAKTLDRLIDSLLCIFPKVEPLPWKTFFFLSFWCALPPSGFITFFTAMGFGEQVYYAIADEFGEYSFSLAVGLLVFMFTLYMLDADQWNGMVGTLVLDMSVLAIVAGFVLLVLLLAYQLPYGMVCLFALFNPLWLLTLKLIIYTNKDTRVFVSWLSGPLFTVSVLIGLSWAVWVFSDPSHQWNEVARINAASRSLCQPDYELFPDCRKEEGSDETCFYLETSSGRQYIVFPEGCSHSCTQVYNDCLNGFILWVGPVLVSMTLFFLSFFCTFFREEAERERDIVNFGKIWIFILFAMWVTASLSGTAAGLTSALAALTLASFVASAVFLTVSFSKEERAQNAAAVYERLREKYGKHLDVIRGLFIVTCAPFILIYFAFSIMNQFIRRTAIFPCSQPARGEDGQVDRYTAKTRVQINMVKSWDRAKVYTYAIYWGMAFMVLQVIIAKLTVVFLSWLITKTSDLGLLIVTAIMWVAGVIMFLLPPVPGVPVYLTLGIVLPAQGHVALGWVGSAAYSILNGLLLKLFSSAIQQKIIGEYLSHYVGVRQFVAINSTLMRAMRLVVGMDGLSVSKVAILIGGPDWPTSVLCGIMRLPLTQILIGTLPVVFLTIPTCVTGTFLYMASVEADGNQVYPWARTLSTITAAFTAIVQFGSMIVAAYYLEQAADKRVEEIESIPIDEEVKEADEKAENLKNCYRDVTQWAALPWFAKWYLRISLACIVTSSYMVQLFSSRCFTPYSLTDSIDENLNGNAANLFLPLGWVAVILFVLSGLFLILFQRRGHQKARMLANETTVAVLNDELGSSRRRSSLNNSLSDPRQQHLDVVEQYSDESLTDRPDVILNRSRSFSSRF